MIFMLWRLAGVVSPTTLLWNRISCVSLQAGISSGPAGNHFISFGGQEPTINRNPVTRNLDWI